MNTVLHPVGPNPSRVYWFRRFVVVLALVVALGGVGAVIWAVAFRDGGSADAVGDPAGAAGASDVPATDEAANPVDCAAEDLEVTLAADATTYPAGSNPVLQGFVTNISTTPCTVDAGDAAREVVISSGSDRIWSTKDCASADTASRQLLLAAGARDAFEIAWSRTRSAEGCPGDLPAPRAGTYQAVATLLGTGAAPVAFVLD
ncbi:hypothetical protein [Pengzhenrongella frigida]|uniref:DUF4232 domain-containing protein n=1 Tax=Pengzhenrongella frigida TaxID=1259133 RepID=A0A4Q5MV83_9MICO|nr:hypothetical protein [Cellulomonas sp. HLT2-17]RYV49420.1 hypothetical protein EUA98_18855 [Cellulomonas sp. HLT2-17]